MMWSKILAVPCTEISATLPASSGSVPIDFRSGNRFAAVPDRDGEANISQQEFHEWETTQSQEEGC